MFEHVPVRHPRPDADRFLSTLLGRSAPGLVPPVEYLVDDALMSPILEHLLDRPWVPEGPGRDAQRGYLDNFVAFWHRMGYDFVRFERSLGFPRHDLLHTDTAPTACKPRAWADQHGGMIRTWADFDHYAWPRLEDVDFFPYEYLNAHLPEGMGLILSHAGGPFEHLSTLMSYEGLCLALYDAPDLVQAVAQHVGELMEGFYAHLLTLDHLIALFPGDDMGFRTSTLIAPAQLQSLTLPWHTRFAEMAHASDRPYFLHSCGNLEGIIETLISEVKIDGKHSYEDAILPVEEFQRRYGGRIAVLGGMDVHRLSAGTPEEIRARVRELVEVCGRRGRYALGSGNSVPSYVPLENYLTMMDEVHALAAIQA